MSETLLKRPHFYVFMAIMKLKYVFLKSNRNMTKKYWGSGLCPSCRILKIRNPNILGTGSISILR
jgi:hypothetical protein